jgi:hypothetical protein
MALIGEAARQRDLCEGQSRNGEEMLGASHADLSHISADGAAEMLVKLPADLNRMAPGAPREIGEGQMPGRAFMKQLADAQQPGGSLAAARWASLAGARQQKLQQQPLDREGRHIVWLTHLAVEPRTQPRCGRRVDLAKDSESRTMLAGELEHLLAELDLETLRSHGKEILVGFPAGKKAHRSRSARLAPLAVP